MKKILCLLLVTLMALPFTGCRLIENIGEVINGVIEHEAGITPAPSEPAATEAAPTEAAPTESIADPTAAPSVEPSAADEEFEALDLEFFQSYICSSTQTYNQFIVSDPERFGIDRDEVEPGWGDLSLESHMAMMDDSRDMLSRLESIDREALSDVNRYGYDALKRAVEVNLMYEDYYYYDEPLTPLNGLQTLMPLSMVFFNIRSLRDVEDYLFLVEDMERYLDLVGVFESEKAEEGLFMTEVALDQVIESLRSFAAMGEESTLITSFDAVAEKAREFGMGEAECASASSRNREAVLEHVLPAYSRLADTLESHRKDCSEFVGAAARGDKAKAYFELSARDEGATMDPMDKVVDLLDEMGNSTYMDLYMAIVFGPDDLYDRYGEDISFGSVENNLEWLGGFVKKYYPEMPDYSLRYIDVPEDIAEDFSPAAYLTPAFDDTYDNLMILNPYSEGSDDLLTIAHETIPGHMYQFLTARNTPGLSVSQQLIEPTGYAEGWTVFSEYFVATHCDEIGSEYCTMMNCESTFFNIYMPAYISIMVNYEGWDLDDVYDLLQEYELDDAAEIFYEYAVTMPNYAMSYAIGYAYMLHIYEEANPRSASEHKAFFEKYLSFGPCYMDMMIEYMR